MKSMVIAGLLSLTSPPVESGGPPCQAEEGRRAPAPVAGEVQTQPNVQPQPALAQREVTSGEQRAAPVRRRVGKRVPDAELIGPRGTL